LKTWPERKSAWSGGKIRARVGTCQDVGKCADAEVARAAKAIRATKREISEQQWAHDQRSSGTELVLFPLAALVEIVLALV
jgi:hypothetical protein